MFRDDDEEADDEVPHARTDRRAGQPPLPRGDDVRRVGQPRPRRVDRDDPRRARRRHQLHRHRRRVLGGRVGGDRRQGDRGPARRHRARHQGATRRMGADPNMAGNSRRWIIRECENSLRRLEHRLHRPLPDAPARSRRRHRRDARRADRPRAPGQGALPRQLDVPGVGDRRGAVGGRAAQPRALRVRAAAVLDPRPRHRGRRAADVPAVRHGRDPVEPARRRLAVGQVAQGRRPTSPATAPPASRRATTSTMPGNQQKLEAADALGAARRRGRASRSCTSRWRGCCATPRSRRRSSARARWSSSRRSSAPPTSTLDRRRARPHRRDRAARAPTSPGPTPATRRRWSPAAAPAGATPADDAGREPPPPRWSRSSRRAAT